MKKILLIAALVIGGSSLSIGTAGAQVAGSTVVGTDASTPAHLAMGWSVKKSLLGKTVYNEADQKVGKVDDLIIAPDKSVSYVIVGAGGFVGIGRHDVAIPVKQIQEQGGKLVMAGATRESIKSMPRFNYANDTRIGDKFVAGAEQDIARGKVKLAELERKAAAAGSDAKARLDAQIATLQADLKTAEDKVAAMKRAGVYRWKEFEADVSAAMAELRASIEKATG